MLRGCVEGYDSVEEGGFRKREWRAMQERKE